MRLGGLKSDISRSASLLETSSSNCKSIRKSIDIENVKPALPVKPVDVKLMDDATAPKLVVDPLPQDLIDMAYAAANGEANADGAPIHLRRHVTREEILKTARFHKNVKVGGSEKIEEP